MVTLGRYQYEHVFIDNASRDNTVAILKYIARQDKNVKIIVNTRNFGHIRSPLYGTFQTRGDAVIGVVADLQDPPEMIPELVEHWENGTPVVLCVKKTSEENRLMFWIRKRYYRLVKRLSEIETYEDFYGFGLFDRQVIDLIKEFKDPYPYFRGMVAEVGLPYKKIYYDQRKRKRGNTKNNLYTLYDLAMLGITNLSKVPLRAVTFCGFTSALLCILISLGYLAYKLFYWDRFTVGMAPLVIGIFFFASMQMIFTGILGEYIGAIHTLVQNRPMVCEKERINFEYPPGDPLPVFAATDTPAVEAQPVGAPTVAG
jgi:glycosyltransferase involved in cell wall biosynthesis